MAINLIFAKTPTDKVKAVFTAVFGSSSWYSAYPLIAEESGFNPYARNSSSGACGIFQANPCEKLPCDLSDVLCQAAWGKDYIQDRYGNPENAWTFHLAANYY